MFYVTGDMHGDDKRLSLLLKANDFFQKGDYLFQLGDFGFLMQNNEEENMWLDEIEDVFDGVILFIDGNHENHAYLNRLPIETWNGGKISKLRSNIYHLLRGQTYHIDGKSFFVFGGAYSIDRQYRELGKTYFDEEMPSKKEYETGKDNLKRCDYNVDYILTHTAPESTMSRFYPKHSYEKPLNDYLEWVKQNVTYRHWYMGHLHQDCDLVGTKQTILYKAFREITTNDSVFPNR